MYDEFFIVFCLQTKRSSNIIDESMKLANQLFDRSSLNATKKDAKLTVDKQAAAATAASLPKKVKDFSYMNIRQILIRMFK